MVDMSLSRGADVSGSGYGERPATDQWDYPSAERTNGGMTGRLKCTLWLWTNEAHRTARIQPGPR